MRGGKRSQIRILTTTRARISHDVRVCGAFLEFKIFFGQNVLAPGGNTTRYQNNLCVHWVIYPVTKTETFNFSFAVTVEKQY